MAHTGRVTEIDPMRVLTRPNGPSSRRGFRLHIADTPKVLSIVIASTHMSLRLSYDLTELILPLCRSGVDLEKMDQKTTWKATNVPNLFNFVGFAGGVILHRRASARGAAQISRTSREVDGGIGVAKMHHR